MHTKWTWRRSKLSDYWNTRTKLQSRIISLVPIYRFLDNSHTKHTSHKHWGGEICKNPMKIAKKRRCWECDPCRGNLPRALKRDPCRRNAAKYSECDPCRENAAQAVKRDPCRENSEKCLECDPSRGNATQELKCDPCRRNVVKCSECDPCHGNATMWSDCDPCRGNATQA